MSWSSASALTYTGPSSLSNWLHGFQKYNTKLQAVTFSVSSDFPFSDQTWNDYTNTLVACALVYWFWIMIHIKGMSTKKSWFLSQVCQLKNHDSQIGMSTKKSWSKSQVCCFRIMIFLAGNYSHFRTSIYLYSMYYLHMQMCVLLRWSGDTLCTAYRKHTWFGRCVAT